MTFSMVLFLFIVVLTGIVLKNMALGLKSNIWIQNLKKKSRKNILMFLLHWDLLEVDFYTEKASEISCEITGFNW